MYARSRPIAINWRNSYFRVFAGLAESLDLANKADQFLNLDSGGGAVTACCFIQLDAIPCNYQYVPTRVGRNAGEIAEKMISHLAGPMGSSVTITIEIEAQIPEGAPDTMLRTVAENARTLRFTSHGFEKE